MAACLILFVCVCGGVWGVCVCMYFFFTVNIILFQTVKYAYDLS